MQSRRLLLTLLPPFHRILLTARSYVSVLHTHYFAHLHSKATLSMPGLRLGLTTMYYPGDPLRFHSQFLATSYEWIKISHLGFDWWWKIGTGVKKGFLIVVEDTSSSLSYVKSGHLQLNGEGLNSLNWTSLLYACMFKESDT